MGKRKRTEKVVAVEYTVQDCPIIGKTIEVHYINCDKKKERKK